MRRLETELKSHVIGLSARDLRRAVRIAFRRKFPRFSEEEVLCHAALPARLVRAVREEVGDPTLPHEIVMRVLLNLRKNPQERRPAVGPAGRPRGYGVHLATTLERHGCALHEDEVRRILLETLESQHPGWNDERLMCDELAPRAYVLEVRRRVGVRLPHHVILRALTNTRKNWKPRDHDKSAIEGDGTSAGTLF